MARRRVLAAASVLLAALAGCGGPGRATAGDGAAPRASFALALGVDPLDAPARRRLGAYDLVVVDGGAGARAVADLRRRGATVLGYLSIGTVEPYRPWFEEARDRGWLLERWEQWDERYADVSAPGLRRLLVAEARRLLARGFDGIFLDNVDMVEAHPAQAAGMAALVADLDRLVGPDRLLFSQNGDDSVDTFRPHLDGWNREDVSSTYDPDHDRYRATTDEERRAAVATLRRLADGGLLVTTTDYTRSAAGDDVAGAVRRACGAGAVPFVSDIDLRRIPSPPPTCP